VHRQQLVLLFPQRVVVRADAEEDRHAVLLDQQLEEVQDHRVGVRHDALEAVLLLLRRGAPRVGRLDEAADRLLGLANRQILRRDPKRERRHRVAALQQAFHKATQQRKFQEFEASRGALGPQPGGVIGRVGVVLREDRDRRTSGSCYGPSRPKAEPQMNVDERR